MAAVTGGQPKHTSRGKPYYGGNTAYKWASYIVAREGTGKWHSSRIKTTQPRQRLQRCLWMGRWIYLGHT